MILIGFECYDGQWRVFNITTMKGEITYWAYQDALIYIPSILQNMPAWLKIAGGVEGWRKSEGGRMWTSTACSKTEWKRLIGYIGEGVDMGLLLYPLEWKDVPYAPSPILANLGPWNTNIGGLPNHCRIFGVPPTLNFKISPLGMLQMKPGNPITLDFDIDCRQGGGTILSTITNKITGKSAELIQPFNPDETVGISTEDKMPGLLPDEVLTIENVVGLSTCNIRELVDTDEAFKQVMERLQAILPPPIVARTTVNPTDCMLADTSGGIIQILGDNLTFSGFIISKDQTGPINGQSPAKIPFTDVSFLSLDFNREIAICENRNILDQSSNHYEYSKFPTPRRSAQMTKWAISTFRPSFPFEGLPLPRYTTVKPKIRVRK